MRVVQREEGPDFSYLERLAEEYKRTKDTITDIEKRANGMKKELSDAVEEFGATDDKGHLWLNVGNLSLKRERRISRSLDIDSAKQWAIANGHWDQVKQVIEVLDEDQLLGLAWNNKELEDTIQAFYIEKETWAFKA